MRKPKNNDLTPDQMRLVKRVLAYAQSDNSLEALEAQRREAEKVAAAELDRLALDLAEKEAERRKLWGNKFPRVPGQKPEETSNPVKTGKGKAKTLVKRNPQKRARTHFEGGRG